MKRRVLWFLAFALLAASAAAATAVLVVRDELAREVAVPGRVVLVIQPGEGLGAVARRLREAGLIGSERIFLWTASWRGVDRRIRHGRHEFEGRLTLSALLDELTRSPKPVLRVTIPEGRTLRETAALLEAAGALSAPSYVAVACSEELRRRVGAPDGASCAEGWLFPDTYDLVPGVSPGTVVDLQVRRFDEVAGPLLDAAAAAPSRPDPAGVAGKGAQGGPDTGAAWRAGIVTLASIIEKETGQAAERPRIASVFYNRLRTGMRLQTDPTVIYGVIDSGAPWDGNLTRAHLETPTPFNTYTRAGLPPSPICNPGRAAIAAALEPATTKDLYFVARGDGSHEFSPDLASHNRAVRRYQLGR